MDKLVAIILLLALNGFFVAAEFALVRARRTRLEAMARKGDPLAKLALRAVDNLSRMLSASQLGITLASLGLGYVAEEALGHIIVGWLGGLPVAMELPLRTSIATGVALTVATYGHVVLGELYPRAVALNHPENFAKWLAVPLFAFVWIATPLIVLFDRSAQLLLRLTRQNPHVKEEQVHEADEIRLIVEQSQEEGKLERENAEMIDAVFEFTEKKARDVMTPRTRMVGLPREATLDEVLAIVAETAYSRYPVYDETMDDIVGVVIAKDLLRAVVQRDQSFTVSSVSRPVLFVPGSREVEEVLADFQRRKEHLAIVLDEYGGTAGLVTMEDLIEELVGEILDEHDESVPPSPTVAERDLVDGVTPIEELNERFGLQLPTDDFSTIGGFVFGQLGRLPAVGDQVTAAGARFTVRAMDGRRIATLLVTAL